MQDCRRIRELLDSTHESAESRKDEEKLRNLKELSDSLKRSWGQTEKVRVDKLTTNLQVIILEKFCCNNQGRNPIAHRKSLADSWFNHVSF